MPAASGTSRARSGAGATGFTLIELIVALAVAGLVLAAAFSGVRVAADAWRRAQSAQLDAIAAESARASLEAWLRAATLLGGDVPFVGVGRTRGGVPRDELTFAVADGGPLYPGPHRIRLWAGRDPGASGPALYAELSPIRNRTLQPGETLEVAPGIAGLEIRYWTRVDGREQWLFAWDSAETLPLAVELRLVPAPHDVMRESVDATLPAVLRLPILAPIGWTRR